MKTRRNWMIAAIVAALVASGILLATAAAPGATGKASAATPTPSASPIVLQVARNGHVAASYTLDQVEAFPAVATYAGYRGGSAHGLDAVTGAAVTDIVAAALGTPLTAAEGLQVEETPLLPSGYSQTFTGGQIIDPKDNYGMIDSMGNPIASTSLTGTIAAVLVYTDADGNVMPVASGPLRFLVADSVQADGAFTVGKNSVSSVNLLNVTDDITISVKPKPHHVALGKSCAFRGVVTNAVVNDTRVALRMVKNGKFVLKGTGTISSSGAYRIVYKPTKVGTFHFVVTYKAGKTFLSKVTTIIVRK